MIQAIISISNETYKEVKKQSDDLSSFVEEALKEHIKRMKIKKGLKAFGKWEQRDQDSTDIVKELRQDKGQREVDDANIDSWDSLDIESFSIDTGRKDGSVNHDFYIYEKPDK